MLCTIIDIRGDYAYVILFSNKNINIFCCNVV